MLIHSLVSQGEVFLRELDLKFFEHSEFESIDNASLERHAAITARNALRLLMMGWTASWTQLLSWPVIRAVLCYRDPTLLKALRLAFQQGFEYLFAQLENTELDPSKKEQVQLFLSNCLSILPYADLTPYESIKIPQYIDEHWVLVDYHIKAIELTQATGFRRFFIKDEDRVFAYGLESIDNSKAQSHLIFMGTTYPAGQGFISQIDTDLRGLETVGYSLYQTGREKLSKWLAHQKAKVHVCGVSLGGSLSLLLALDQCEKIARVDALNPPGLHDPLSVNVHDRWNVLHEKPLVVVQQQGNDPVSLFGLWKKEWNIVRVMPPIDKQGPNAFCDHFLNYAGLAGTQFSTLNPEEENKKRIHRNFWLFTLARSFVYYALFAPYRFIIRPIAYFIYEQRYPVLAAVMAGLALVSLAIPLLYLAAGVVAFCALLCSFSKKTTSTLDVIREERAALHQPELPRNAKMDIYAPENKINLDLSYGELHTYYYVMRSLVKGKAVLPDEDNAFKHQEGVSKRQLLKDCDDSTRADEIIHLKTTKAKALHIRHTLGLVEKIGVKDSDKLKSEAIQGYNEYCLGKRP